MIRDEDIILIREPKLSAADKLYLNQIANGMRVTLSHLFYTKGRRTVQYPEQKRAMREENYRGVHRLNRDAEGRVACVACFMCATACPANCIHIVADESPWEDREKYPLQFDLDELRCIYCGMCEEACPCDAIELTPEFDIVGNTRDEMVFDKEKLLEVFDKTSDAKPRKNPKITGHYESGDRSKYDALRAKLQGMASGGSPSSESSASSAQSAQPGQSAGTEGGANA